MKKLAIMSALALGSLAFKTADAQIGIHVNLHLGGAPVIEQPVYADDYYYLPDVEAYYSVPEHCYYYNDGYNWVSAAYLPGYYRNFDWRSARHIEIRSSRPYLQHNVYRGRFGGFSNRNDFYARAFPNRGRGMRDERFGGHDQFDRHEDNRGGWNGQRGGFDRDERNNGYEGRGRNQGGFGQDHGQGGYHQEQGADRGRGGFGQPQGQDRGQGGFGEQHGQGGYNQQQGQGQGNWGQGQDRGGRGQGQQNGGGQTTNQNGGRDRGNFGGGQQHFSQNSMGVTSPDRGVAMNRPARF